MENQVSLEASETIMGKEHFEQWLYDTAYPEVKHFMAIMVSLRLSSTARSVSRWDRHSLSPGLEHSTKMLKPSELSRQ